MTFNDIKESICLANCKETIGDRIQNNNCGSCRGCPMFELNYEELKQMRLRDLYGMTQGAQQPKKKKLEKVITCKECVYFQKGWIPCRNDYGMPDPMEDDYCSCAVRR